MVSKVSEFQQKKKPNSYLAHKGFTPLLKYTSISKDFSSGGKSEWDQSDE